MSRKLILSSILHEAWLIQPEFAFASSGLIQRVLSGDLIIDPYKDDGDRRVEEKPPAGCFTISPTGEVTFSSGRDPFINAAPGSTAIISMTGPIMKYDNCGDPGTKTYGGLLAKARRNPNITSAVIVADSPGGTVSGTQELSDTVKNFGKPIVSLVDGLMCSAMYWIGSSADEIIAMNETSNIGSIGTMLSFADVQGYWDKQGVKLHYVYADASKDKNQDFHQLQAGNYDLVKAELNKINDVFLSAVKSNRPNIKESALTGKTFLAKDALAQGLIDSIGSFEMAVERAQQLAGIKNSSNTNSKSQHKTMKKVTLTAAHPALLALCGKSIAAGESSVEVELDALEAAASKSANDLKAAQDEVTAANTKITEAQTKATQAEEKATKAEGELAILKASNPGSTTTVKKGDDKVESSSDNDFHTEYDDRVSKAKSDWGVNQN